MRLPWVCVGPATFQRTQDDSSAVPGYWVAVRVPTMLGWMLQW
jgi:hypothetical protein